MGLMERGEIWWATLPRPRGSEPGFRRPFCLVQSDEVSRSRISTVLAATVTTNLRLGAAPGNVIVHPEDSELAEVSVINVSQLVTLNRDDLEIRVGQLPQGVMRLVDQGLRLILDLA